MFPFEFPCTLNEREATLTTAGGPRFGGVLCRRGAASEGAAAPADFDDLYDAYRKQVRLLEEAKVDFLLLRSSQLADLRAAVLAARTTGLPLLASLEVDASGRGAGGGELLPTVIVLQAMGVEAVGLSCEASVFQPEWLTDVLPHTEVPLFACVGGDAPLVMPDSYIDADCYAAAIESEAFFLGDNIEYSEPLPCSPHLAERLIDVEDARVNTALVSVESLDDAAILSEESAMARLPLAVCCSSLPVLDAALRYFQGRLIIDSDCPLEEEEIAPLAAKYGAIIY